MTHALTIVAVSDAYLKATMTRREEILGRHPKVRCGLWMQA